MTPSNDATASVPGSVGIRVEVTIASSTKRTALTSWTPAVTRRLPINRLASAVATSIVPQDSAAPRPVSRPKGIGAAYGARLAAWTEVPPTAPGPPQHEVRAGSPAPGRPRVAC